MKNSQRRYADGTRVARAGKSSPDNRLYVIDLTADRSKLIDTVATGEQVTQVVFAPGGARA